MAKKTTTPASDTAITVVGQISAPATKADVPKTLEMLREQLANLKKNVKDEISLDITYSGPGGSRNIKDVTKVTELLEIWSAVKARGAAFESSVADFKLEGQVKPFQVSEKSVEDWRGIIDKAIFELRNKVKIETLEKTIKDLSQHLSEEEKFKKTMEDAIKNANELLS